MLSYAGLQSNYSLAGDKETVVRPTRWPVADLPQMPEPMPRAFDVEKFDSLGLSEDVKPTIQNKPGPSFIKWEAEEEMDEMADEDEPPPYTEAGPSEPTRNLHAEQWENAKNKQDWDSGDARQSTRSNPPNEPRKFGFFRRLLVIVSRRNAYP